MPWTAKSKWSAAIILINLKFHSFLTINCLYLCNHTCGVKLSYVYWWLLCFHNPENMTSCLKTWPADKDSVIFTNGCILNKCCNETELTPLCNKFINGSGWACYLLRRKISWKFYPVFIKYLSWLLINFLPSFPSKAGWSRVWGRDTGELCKKKKINSL